MHSNTKQRSTQDSLEENIHSIEEPVVAEWVFCIPVFLADECCFETLPGAIGNNPPDVPCAKRPTACNPIHRKELHGYADCVFE